MNDILTSDLAELGHRERDQLQTMLWSWGYYGLPENFWEDKVTFMFNRNSGYVFLTNSEYQVAMLNDDNRLEEWHNTPYHGHEGFLEDLVDLYPEMHPDDQEWFDGMVLYAYRGEC